MTAAPATTAIAAATIIVSLAASFILGDAMAALRGGFVPGRASLGLASDLPGLVPVILTPLTAALLHGGILHLAMNMVMLVALGRLTEQAIGPWGLVVLYLAGAVVSAAAQWLADPGSAVPMVGASGAISAIVGASALLYGRQRTRDIGPVPGWLLHVLWLLAAWVLINLAFGLVAASAGIGVAVAAHIGGFVTGLVLCRPLLLWKWRGA